MINRTSSFFDRVALSGTPDATMGSHISCGNARFTMLTNRLVRMEWSAGAFEDRATFAFPSRRADLPEFTVTLQDTDLKIDTQYLSIHYIDDGRPFHAENLSVICTFDDQPVTWVPGTTPHGNLRGTSRTLDQCADATNLQEGLLSREGWSLFDDSGTPVWGVDQRWVEARSDDHLQDWYFFGYGHAYKDALADYVRFGGQIPMIPRYVLGAWWSRFWSYSADDLKQLVRDFKDHDVPLDVLVVDMDWHTPYAWTGYTWNRELFPDPVAFLAWVHEQGLYVTLNLHPAQGVQKHEEIYPQFAELLGKDPTTGESIKFSPTDKRFIQLYFELLHHPMEEQGVDFWWLDWQQGDSSGLKGLDPLPWLNHLHFQDSMRRGTRPMLYSRWGGLGNHRYPIGFSGDTYATWESLRFQSYFTPTAANVCYGWWSHDIGGHFGATDPELYARWVQFGAVGPCLRLHSTKDPLAERKPWGFPTKVYEAAKAAFQFRYKLMPYLYSAARQGTQQGLALCYPMYYEYPDAEDAYVAREQYFLGDQMIAAPVVRPADPANGLANVDVWIPDGTWIEYTSLETYTGPQWVRLQADLNHIPLFVKAGAILPMASNLTRTQDFDGSHLILTVFPEDDGRFALYEDDGVSEGYKSGEYATTLIHSTQLDDKSLSIRLDPSQGYYSGLADKRTIEIHLKGSSQPDRVTVNGSDVLSWHYEPSDRQLTVTIEDADRREALEVVVHAEGGLSALYAPKRATSEAFVRVLDYATLEDSRQQLGSAIIAPHVTPFDAQIEWTLYKGGEKTISTTKLEHCTGRQIVHCPFADDGTINGYRWSVSINLTWGDGQQSTHVYESQPAYPALNRWHTLIVNPEQQPLTVKDVTTSEGDINPALAWTLIEQTPTSTLHLRQPFGIVLLEQDRACLLNHEPLKACLSTTLTSSAAQEVILWLQSVGDDQVYLNGSELSATDPIQHKPLDPMFYSWMQPAHKYYRLSLRAGANNLILFTRPTADWWGIGATLLNASGEILISDGESLQ